MVLLEMCNFKSWNLQPQLGIPKNVLHFWKQIVASGKKAVLGTIEITDFVLDTHVKLSNF